MDEVRPAFVERVDHKEAGGRKCVGGVFLGFGEHAADVGEVNHVELFSSFSLSSVPLFFVDIITFAVATRTP